MAIAELTDARVKAFKCESGRRLAELRDATLPGLELRVTANGSKSWRLHYTRRSDGKRRAVPLGKYPSLSLKNARRKAKQLQAEIEDNEKRADPAAKRQARKEAVTFEELANDWIDRHGKVNKSERAVRDDQSMLKLHINPEIGSMKAIEVRKRDVIRLLDAVKAKADARPGEREPTRQKRLSVNSARRRKPAGTAPAPRRMTHRPNRVFETVRAIFRWAVGRDVLQIDPTAGIAPPIKKEKARERELSPDEIRALWKALEATPTERRKLPKGSPTGTHAVGATELKMTRATALAIQLALVTAQRIGEVAGIAKSELDLNDIAPIWVIPGERTKNGEPNRVPLSPLAVKLIKAAASLSADNKQWLFPSAADPKKAINPHAPTKALERSRDALNIENFRIHDLRRTAATGMAELGINPHTVSLVLNHISVRRGTITGKVYDRYSYDREKRDALTKWGAQVVKLLNGSKLADFLTLPGLAQL